MDKPTLEPVQLLPYFTEGYYERYLPSAFDNSMNIYEQLVSIMEYLNKTGKLVNDLALKWNEVMLWIMNDGLNDAVKKRIDELIQDGTMAEIINQEIFGKLNLRIQQIYVNVMDFGAIGDGVADDTDAIQRAIDSVKDKGGGVVYFPSATFYRTSKPIYTYDSIKLKGFSAKASNIKNYGEDYTIISLGTGINNVNRYQGIEDLTITGTNTSKGGIKLQFSGEFFTLKNLRVLDHPYGNGIDLPNSFSGVLQNIHVSRCTNGSAIRMYGNDASTGQTTFINVVCAYSKIGMEIGDASSLTANIIDGISIIGCIVQHNTDAGIQIGANVRQLKIMSTHFEWQNGAGARGLYIKGKTAIGGDIDSCWFYENNTGIEIDYANNYKLHNLNIQNSTIGVYFTGNSVNNVIGEHVRFANVTEEIRDYSLVNYKITESTIMLNTSYKERNTIVSNNTQSLSTMDYTTVPGSIFRMDKSNLTSLKNKTAKYRLKCEVVNGTQGDIISMAIYDKVANTLITELNGSIDSNGLLLSTSAQLDFPASPIWAEIRAKSLTVASRPFTVQRVYLLVEYV